MDERAPLLLPSVASKHSLPASNQMRSLVGNDDGTEAVGGGCGTAPEKSGGLSPALAVPVAASAATTAGSMRTRCGGNSSTTRDGGSLPLRPLFATGVGVQVTAAKGRGGSDCAGASRALVADIQQRPPPRHCGAEITRRLRLALSPLGLVLGLNAAFSTSPRFLASDSPCARPLQLPSSCQANRRRRHCPTRADT